MMPRLRDMDVQLGTFLDFTSKPVESCQPQGLHEMIAGISAVFVGTDAMMVGYLVTSSQCPRFRCRAEDNTQEPNYHGRDT